MVVIFQPLSYPKLNCPKQAFCHDRKRLPLLNSDLTSAIGDPVMKFEGIFVFASSAIFCLSFLSFCLWDFWQFIYFKKSEGKKKGRVDRNKNFRQEECLDKERRRLAFDLHDCLGSLLWSAKVNVAFIRHKLKMYGEIKQSFCELAEILDQSLENLQLILYGLAPEAFRQKGLSGSLCKMCNQIDGKGIKVSFQESGSVFWNDNQALEVYRIVQELICNSIKHSQATALTVWLRWDLTQLLIKVFDDGLVFRLEKERVGIGWLSIRHRVKQLGADIKLESMPGEIGSKISLVVPLDYNVLASTPSTN